MSDYRKPNFLPAFLLLFTLLLLITSSQLSLTSNVYGKSDKASDNARGQDNGNNGKDDDGGSGDDDDGGSGDDGSDDDGDDGGSGDDGSDDGGSGDDGSDDGGSGDDGSDDDGDDGGSGDDGSDDDGDDGGSGDDGSENNVHSDTTDGEPNKNNEQTLVSQGDNQTVQVGNQIAQDKYKGKVFYILIKSANNQTDFVPDKVTLSEGSKVVWLNSDNSGHRITVGSESKSDYALLNSLILPNGVVDQEFKSAGTYYYSDLDSPQSHGIITILDKAEKNAAISESPND
jgi:plastocyanin